MSGPHVTGRHGLTAFGCLVLGLALGAFAKYLEAPVGQMPGWLAALDRRIDLHNVLSGFALWLLLALCLAVFSRRPTQGAVRVLLFFVGVVASYYLWTYFVAGFAPNREYLMLWVGLTVASPFLGALCWYARGERLLSVVLSGGILGVFCNLAFAFGLLYVSLRSVVNLGALLLALAVLWKRPKNLALTLVLAVVFAVLIRTFSPISIG